MSDCYESRDIERNGTAYRVEFIVDYDMGAPWEEDEGHGIVSDWETRDKKPGEVVINEDHGGKRFYDVAATTRIAKRDKWGLNDDSRAKLAKKLGRAPTAGEIRADAVRLDLERMAGWCNDDWHWCGVEVFPLTDDGDELRSKTESLWGIESDAGAYFDEVIEELIAQIEG